MTASLAPLPAFVRDMAERMGLPAALAVVEQLGGTTIPVPMRATVLGEERYRRLSGLLGADIAAALCREYSGTDVYVPNCRQALIDARDAAVGRDRDELSAGGYSEREIVATLALQYKMSDRQIWRILKKPPQHQHALPDRPVQGVLC